MDERLINKISAYSLRWRERLRLRSINQAHPNQSAALQDKCWCLSAEFWQKSLGRQQVFPSVVDFLVGRNSAQRKQRRATTEVPERAEKVWVHLADFQKSAGAVRLFCRVTESQNT